nr:MAG TPA: hypothetical protein [Caudoviricetes sp.]
MRRPGKKPRLMRSTARKKISKSIALFQKSAYNINDRAAHASACKRTMGAITKPLPKG